MRNVFLQKDFGSCFLVCASNLFNDSWFLDADIDISNGISIKQRRSLIEMYTKHNKVREYTLNTVLYSHFKTKNYLPVFRDLKYTDLDENTDYYKPFFVTVKSERKGYNHCILVIKELHNDFLTVLDPLNMDGKTIHVKKFFKKYKPYYIEELIGSDGSHYIFSSALFKHLFDGQPSNASGQ